MDWARHWLVDLHYEAMGNRAPEQVLRHVVTWPFEDKLIDQSESDVGDFAFVDPPTEELPQTAIAARTCCTVLSAIVPQRYLRSNQTVQDIRPYSGIVARDPDAYHMALGLSQAMQGHEMPRTSHAQSDHSSC
jgi:hypothetical protein